MKKFCKLGFLFIVGALIYLVVEILWDGNTHWTMGLLGGVCFVSIGGLNEFLNWNLAIWKQCLLGSLLITTLEFVFGVILNIWLGLNVWDYSTLPLNIKGQICLPFSLIWIVMSGVAIVLDDWLRYWLFKEERPHYKIW